MKEDRVYNGEDADNPYTEVLEELRSAFDSAGATDFVGGRLMQAGLEHKRREAKPIKPIDVETLERAAGIVAQDFDGEEIKLLGLDIRNIVQFALGKASRARRHPEVVAYGVAVGFVARRLQESDRR